MTLAINPDEVDAILVGGQWHDIEPGSLYFDAYEFFAPGEERFAVYVSEAERPTISTRGFSAILQGSHPDKNLRINGTFTALQAVREREWKR
jgi:hypothetical protein